MASGAVRYNQEKTRELWNIHAKGWWPEGPQSPSLAIIRVRVASAECWDGPSNTSYKFTANVRPQC